MKRALKISRGIQLVGCIFLIWMVVSCADGGLSRGGEVGWKLIVGLFLIIVPRIYEWLTKE